jgi:hypothetical protein
LVQVTDFRPEYWNGSDIVGRFNVNIDDSIRLMGLKLKQKPDGSFRTVAPRVGGNSAFHLKNDIFSAITTAAEAAYRQVPNAKR